MAAPGTDKWLERVFSARSNEAVTRTYDEWAASYDTDIVSIGYANPAVLPALSLATFPHLTPAS